MSKNSMEEETILKTVEKITKNIQEQEKKEAEKKEQAQHGLVKSATGKWKFKMNVSKKTNKEEE